MGGSTDLTAVNPIRLVAKFLLSNGYLDTLQTLAEESNVRLADLGLEEADVENITLESLLEERRLRELSLEMARTRLVELEIPSWSSVEFNVTSLPLRSSTNVLFVTVEKVCGSAQILVTTADRAIRLYDVHSLELRQEYNYLHSSPILEARVLYEQYMLTAGMDGKVVVTDLSTEQIKVQQLENPHSKYVNRLVTYKDKWIATSGYDKKVNLYEVTECSTTNFAMKLQSSLTLPTLPEGLLFTMAADDELVLVICARETCFLEYYSVPSLSLHSRHNMNQNKDLWISFAGVDISQQPTGPRYLGLSTSTTPSGRWLAFEIGKEEMKANIFHGAPQSDLGVLPRHVWRPDGSGFWGEFAKQARQIG